MIDSSILALEPKTKQRKYNSLLCDHYHVSLVAHVYVVNFFGNPHCRNNEI
jgi:hypothetical protein